MALPNTPLPQRPGRAPSEPSLPSFFGKEAVNEFQKVRQSIQSLEPALQLTYVTSISTRSAGLLPEQARMLFACRQDRRI
jgi:hypothetical protein